MGGISKTSTIEGTFDGEYHYLIQCNLESKEAVVSITWNRMHLMDYSI